jgi:phage gp36-like protein
VAYAQQGDLNIDADRLVELTDNASAPGVIDNVLLATLETQSETIVNAKLAGAAVAGGFVVPFTGTVPAIITFITASIWAYRLYRHRPEIATPQDIADDYKLAFAMMDQIVVGEINLTLGATPNLAGVPEIESSDPRGWTPRDLVTG